MYIPELVSVCGVLDNMSVWFKKKKKKKLFGYQTPLTSYDNYQFKEMVLNISQSYILFQIIINFLNNTWYLKISLNPMMCMALTGLHGVHDNLRYDGVRNILAIVMFNTSSLSSLLFLPPSRISYILALSLPWNNIIMIE